MKRCLCPWSLGKCKSKLQWDIIPYPEDGHCGKAATENNTHWWRCRKTRTGCTAVGTVWRCLKTLKLELPYDPATAPLGIYMLKRIESRVSKRLYMHVHSSTVHTSQEVDSCPRICDRWVCGTYIQWHILQCLKARKFWHMLHHGWTLKTSCKVE